MMFPSSQIPHALPKEARLIKAADDELSNLNDFLWGTGDFVSQDQQSVFRFYDLSDDPLTSLATLTSVALRDWLHAHSSIGKQADAERSVRTQAVSLFFSLAGTHLASGRQHFKHQRGTAEQRKLLLRFEIDYLNQRYQDLRPNQFVLNDIDLIPRAVQMECISIASEPHSLSPGVASDHLRDALLKELHQAERQSESWIHSRLSTHHPSHKVPSRESASAEDVIRAEYEHLGLKRMYLLNSNLLSQDNLSVKLEHHIKFLNDFQSYLSDPKGFSSTHDPHVDSIMEMAASEALLQAQVVIPTGHSAILSNILLWERVESAEIFRRQTNDLSRGSEEARRMIAAFHMYADFIEDPSSQNSYALSNPLVRSLIQQFLSNRGVVLSYATALSNQYTNNPSAKRAVDRIISSLADTNSMLEHLNSSSR